MTPKDPLQNAKKTRTLDVHTVPRPRSAPRRPRRPRSDAASATKRAPDGCHGPSRSEGRAGRPEPLHVPGAMVKRERERESEGGGEGEGEGKGEDVHADVR